MASIVAGEIKDVHSELCTRTRKHYHGLFYVIKVYKFLFTIVWYYIDDEFVSLSFYGLANMMISGSVIINYPKK